MTSPLLELFRHKTWANLAILEFCEGLDTEHLDATMPGTYGSVRDTLRHMVSADSNYVLYLRGERVGEAVDDDTPIEALAEQVRLLAPVWEALVETPELYQQEIINPRRTRWMRGVIQFAQAIQHADEHRSHVLTILSARGLAIPDLDIWSYGETQGMVRALTPPPPTA